MSPKSEEDSLDHSKEIEGLYSVLGRVICHSDQGKIEHIALQIELKANKLVLHKQMTSSRKVR